VDESPADDESPASVWESAYDGGDTSGTAVEAWVSLSSSSVILATEDVSGLINMASLSMQSKSPEE